MRLLLDEHFANQIAEQLRATGHDVRTVSERGLKGMDDESLLILSEHEDRALVTNNVRDFVALARAWQSGGLDHAGLLLTSDEGLPRHKAGIGRYVTVLSALMVTNPADRALAHQVRWLSQPPLPS